ncbi:MAG: metallophosphoesterase [Verrucomicrobiales bacterium]|nr:metallophosphoesterase [Verrucomicrobiales bacterium]
MESLDNAPEESFSIVVIPDTQAYLGRGTAATPDSDAPVTNPSFESHINWIKSHLEPQRIAFVSHVGDLVDLNIPSQWVTARALMNRLKGSVPFGFSPGNRDMQDSGDSSLFQSCFGADQYRHFPWYGDSFTSSREGFSGNNANSFQLFEKRGIKVIFLHLECNAPDDVVDWANEILAVHGDRLALITTHMGWGPLERPRSSDDYVTAPKGRMTWCKTHGKKGNSPQQLWEKCYRIHSHLFAVFSGDQIRTEAFRAASTGRNGNLIHEITQDYGNTLLRLYRFLPEQQRVDAFTIDSHTTFLCGGTPRHPGKEQHQFQIPWLHSDD